MLANTYIFDENVIQVMNPLVTFSTLFWSITVMLNDYLDLRLDERCDVVLLADFNLDFFDVVLSAGFDVVLAHAFDVFPTDGFDVVLSVGFNIVLADIFFVVILADGLDDFLLAFEDAFTKVVDVTFVDLDVPDFEVGEFLTKDL